MLASCGPSDEEVQRLADQRIVAALTAVPTPTSIYFPTPLPTATPVAFPPTATPVTFPTPLPTATPVAFPPTATPVTFPTPLPTATPVAFPPTPTPVTFPTPLPTATPQATATPVTFPTPLPTATPQPTPTPQPSATPQPVVDFNAAYNRVWNSVFFIETPVGTGSGWLIEPGLILTNEHVVSGFTTVTVRQSGDPPFSATVLATDAQRDIALLTFNAAIAQLPEGVVPLPLGEITTDDIARSLMALGYSGAGVKDDGTVGAAAANVGVFSQVIDFGAGGLGLNLEMDVPVDPGDSGGPVLDAGGFVVGMVRAVQEQTAGGQRVVGTFYAVHVDEIRDALPSLKLGQSR